MQVSATEFGLIRLFALDLTSSDIEDPDDSADLLKPLRAALGASRLNPEYVDVFEVSDLDDLGLRGYMVQGLGISKKDVSEDAMRLDSVTGPVVVILSKAFDGIAQDLSPQSPLRWIGTYKEEKAFVHFEPLPSGGSEGVIENTVAEPIANPHLNVLWAILALPVLLGLAGIVGYLLLK